MGGGAGFYIGFGAAHRELRGEDGQLVGAQVKPEGKDASCMHCSFLLAAADWLSVLPLAVCLAHHASPLFSVLITGESLRLMGPLQARE
jgi:hypothetical protein